VIPARGLVVCPGFIDAHSHDDLYLMADPKARAKIRQGVTTTSIGHCGLSVAPWTPEHLRSSGTPWASSAPLTCRPTSGGTAAFGLPGEAGAARAGNQRRAPGGPRHLRVAAMGMAQRDPSSGELSEMRRLLAEALEAGAFGLSSGLIYPPGATPPPPN